MPVVVQIGNEVVGNVEQDFFWRPVLEQQVDCFVLVGWDLDDVTRIVRIQPQIPRPALWNKMMSRQGVFVCHRTLLCGLVATER